tara:strand:+ start:325 stop:681 length:357 start_codon:yes stop_codon:yes gene_type:complete
MTCELHSKLNAAYEAARAAFDEAHNADALDDSTLNLLFVYYQGIKKIAKDLPEHKEHEDVVLPDGSYDPDYNITFPTPDVVGGGAADYYFQTGGNDVLSFDTKTAGFTTPVSDTITFG